VHPETGDDVGHGARDRHQTERVEEHRQADHAGADREDCWKSRAHVIKSRRAKSVNLRDEWESWP
jgi:hypothetical protein